MASQDDIDTHQTNDYYSDENDNEEHEFRVNQINVIPDNFNDLNCCIICGLIKSSRQFQKDGCENCNEDIPEYKHYYNELCTQKYNGMISMLRPDKSWIARCYNLKESAVCGLYGIEVKEISLTHETGELIRQVSGTPLYLRSQL
ncbi:Suppressor of ty [Entamoeba marina]